MLFWQPGPNLWFGVRLPWTLADPYIWKKSWRLASRLLMVMGVTALISWRAFWISTAHLVGLSCLYTRAPLPLEIRHLAVLEGPGWIDYRPVVRCAHCGHFQKLASHADLARAPARPAAPNCRCAGWGSGHPGRHGLRTADR